MAQGEGWAHLPNHLLEMVGHCLDSRGWAAARQTCTHWANSVTGAIRLLEIDLENDAHR
jgi:hypothetical protein